MPRRVATYSAAQRVVLLRSKHTRCIRTSTPRHRPWASRCPPPTATAGWSATPCPRTRSWCGSTPTARGRRAL